MTSARDLSSQLAALLRRERAVLAEFLLALADFDRRRAWLELGHASLFYFLHRELGLSKGAAFYRKTAAELIQKFPEVVEPLREGRLCLTSVVELSKVLTPENRADVLPRFFHLSKREAKAVSAALQPDEAPPHREVVTTLRVVAGVPPPCSLEPFPTPTRQRGERARERRRSCLAVLQAPTGRCVQFIRMNHLVPTPASQMCRPRCRSPHRACRQSRSSRSPPRSVGCT